MPLEIPGLDMLRSGSFRPEAPALLQHKHFQIQVLLTHGAPGDFRFHVMVCIQS